MLQKIQKHLRRIHNLFIPNKLSLLLKALSNCVNFTVIIIFCNNNVLFVKMTYANPFHFSRSVHLLLQCVNHLTLFLILLDNVHTFKETLFLLHVFLQTCFSIVYYLSVCYQTQICTGGNKECQPISTVSAQLNQIVSEQEIRVTKDVQLVVDVVKDISENINRTNNVEAPKVVPIIHTQYF